MFRIFLTVTSFFLVCVLVSPAVSQKIDKKPAQLKKEITRLKAKLKKIRNKNQRDVIIDKINAFNLRLKKATPAKSRPLSRGRRPVRLATLEAVEATHEAEEAPGEIDSAKFLDDYKRLRFELGGVAGVFGGTTAFLAEARLPLRWMLGPTTSVLRFSAGLAQTREMDRRYLPVNLDLIFNFPPGWFSGVGGYLGAGLNYVVRSTGGQAGTIGLQILYGVDSDGFGGKLFGEIGYGILRSGVAPSNRGPNVLFGYRRVFGL